MTTQDMYDEAIDEGASIFHINCDVFLKVTDDGTWWLVSNGEVEITEAEAREILW
jgi:hypothetical protein